jgi:NRPS condensation-like uncharacterized protein
MSIEETKTSFSFLYILGRCYEKLKEKLEQRPENAGSEHVEIAAVHPGDT